MGIFKKIYCAECGEETNPFTRYLLSDDNYLCKKCIDKIPFYMFDTFSQVDTLQKYRKMKSYIEYSQKELRPAFHRTSSFNLFNIDAEKGLMYIGADIEDNTAIFKITDVTEIDVKFVPEEYKEKLFSDYMYGMLLSKIKVRKPYFYYESTQYNVKVGTKKRWFRNEILYDNPYGMDEFLVRFQEAYDAAVYRENQYNEAQSYNQVDINELQQAMALFMLDTLDNVTLADIKKQRNRLIKVYHPDTGSAADTKFAQKINNAYEILKLHINS